MFMASKLEFITRNFYSYFYFLFLYLFSLLFSIFFLARFYMTIMAATNVKGSKLTDNLFPRVLSYPPHGGREGRVGENPGNEVD